MLLMDKMHYKVRKYFLQIIKNGVKLSNNTSLLQTVFNTMAYTNIFLNINKNGKCWVFKAKSIVVYYELQFNYYKTSAKP